MRTALIWVALVVAVISPLIAAAFSPQLAWRDGVYITSGFAGILAMGLLLVQPLLAAGDLRPLSAVRSRQIHRAVGGLLVTAIAVHVGGLWITSPPDVIDALLFVSPTPFSLWGVIAMWGVFAAATMAILRRRVRVRPMTWRRVHVALAVIVAGTTVAHAALIEGTMEFVSKITVSALLLLATGRIAYLTMQMRRRD
jgi:hypothetical protein